MNFLNTSHYHCTLAIHYLILSSTQSFLRSESESHSVCIPVFASPCTSVHGILQARILEWVVFPFSRESSKPRDQTQVSSIAAGFFNNWAIRESIPQHSLILIFLRWRWQLDKWPKVLTSYWKSQTEYLGLIQIWLFWMSKLLLPVSHVILSHVERGSWHLYPSLEVLAGPGVQILPVIIIIRWAQWSKNPG